MFSEQPLDRNHAFDRISKKKPRLAGTFFFPLYKFRGTRPGIYEFVRKFYFMRAAAQSTRVEMLLFDRLKSLSRLRKDFFVQFGGQRRDASSRRSTENLHDNKSKLTD